MIRANSHRIMFGKKSQSELLGFAIVVLLIAVGMLFVIGFIVLDEKTDSRTTYLYKQTATNLNDALLETTTTCRNLNIRELYLICLENDREMCPSDDIAGSPDDSSMTACNYLRQFIENRFGETLDVLGYDYDYSYRYEAVNAQSQLASAPIRSDTLPANRGSCTRERSTLILSGTKQIIIFLDIYAC